MKILGIETSCDETAVAIVEDNKKILANLVLSQLKEHAPYGGVVPEIAARAHMNVLDDMLKQSLQQASLSGFEELDSIAVTAGPGLIGGVIVGVMYAKAIASVTRLPLVAVNHLEGHALTARLTDNVEFPFLLLLFSGGHCQILVVEGVGKYQKLGETIDDALGEAYDKVAKMLNLGYPGGPIVEKMALKGDRKKYHFPRSMTNRKNCDFSFSGLKTAVKRQIDSLSAITEQDIYDICASFEECCKDIVLNRLENALVKARKINQNITTCVLSGGVAANKFLRGHIKDKLYQYDIEFKAPPIKLCTDNAAMIAWAGIENYQKGNVSSLNIAPRARWSLC